jgi:hypothetical protein
VNFRNMFGAVIGSLLAVPTLVGFVSGNSAGNLQIPFSIVRNAGQSDPQVRYIGNGPHFKAWFENNGVIFQQGAAFARLTFQGGRSAPVIEEGEPVGAHANYLRGGDPSRWVTDLPMLKSIVYREVWPGIDVRFKAEDSYAKAEYLVGPGASPAEIRLKFDGIASIERDGSLTVTNRSGRFSEDKPILFQEGEEGRVEVAGGFRTFNDGSVGFTASDYDPAKPLIVDPTILFSGYFGGVSQSTITSVAINSYYNTVVAGWTIGSDLPASGGAQKHYAGGVDAFVAGFSAAGGNLLFCTYLGGSADDRAFGVAVDAANNTYITGQTSSTNFPVVNAVQTKLKGTRDAFVAKLNAAGNALVYSTYLGGTGVDLANAITVDSTNSAIIVGDTTSTNLPVTTGSFQAALAGAQDVFVTKLSPAGNTVTWLTYFGGNAVDHAAALKQDSTGNLIFGGYTYSTNFPTISAFQPQSGGGQDGFVVKMTPNGTSAIFSTYIGGSGGSAGAPEEVNAVGVFVTGEVVVAGTTSSVDFPITSGVVQSTYGGGNTDGFYAGLIATTGALSKSTYLGGMGDDGITGMTADMAAHMYLTGYTTSPDFPVLKQTQALPGGQMDAFVAEVAFGRIIFATYLGGWGNDSGTAITIDSLTNIVVVGTTGSGNFPVVASVGGPTGSVLSSFVTKFAANFTLGLAATPAFLLDKWHDTGFNGSNINLATYSYGVAGDIPVVGDWTGSGVKRIGVFRNGTWILDTNGNGQLDSGDLTVPFGQAGDVPVLGDWNGTGRIKLGLFRQGTFILDLSGHLSGIATGLSDATFSFGLSGDIPVAADWNGSGTSKVGVFRAGQWLVDYNGDRVFNNLDKTYLYGQAGDIPVVGDWSSTGTSNEIGVYRNGFWILNIGGSNSIISPGYYELYVPFGANGYMPLVF